MRYICLIYNSVGSDGTLNTDETEQLVRDHFRCDSELREEGILIHADALDSPETATVLRVRNGTLSATDGPYVETKEHLAGLYVIEARDLTQAKEIVARIPCSRYGAIEVRPVKMLTLAD
ncbi:dehydrogenase [Rhizobium grahamii]|uniref:Dehydrogenase n=1 Tax=Rhizobium grahamii TaxID=1120045 RepID=A0A5Q0C281_9HYPH|nr:MULTISPECIES: YciI family protein [Rhizobium]QFY59543.1 dehydrogenase [Rhizobium grahamii]QRM47934.1 dehydrogenase [Rhizobium sp. BG6]